MGPLLNNAELKESHISPFYSSKDHGDKDKQDAQSRQGSSATSAAGKRDEASSKTSRFGGLGGGNAGTVGGGFGGAAGRESRSGSTATITQAGMSSSAGGAGAAAVSGSGSSGSASIGGGAGGSIPNIPNSTVKPGLLVVTVIEAKGLTIPNESIRKDSLSLWSNSFRSSGGSGGFHSRQRSQAWYLPYVVLEFDKNEILIDCLESSPLAGPRWDFEGKYDVSRPSALSCQIYLRSSLQQKRQGSGDKPSSGSDGGSNGGAGADGDGQHPYNGDIFLGGAKIVPSFVEKKVFDDWVPLQGGTGQIHLRIRYEATQQIPLTIEAFDLLKVVGKGSFGKVMQVRKIDTSRIYALKTIRKAHIVSRSEVDHTLAERTVLAQVNNPFIVPLKFTFQSPEKLYIVLAFINGGELFHHLQREGRFSVWRSKFYAAELLCALEHLHSFNVIYRDLKPENILLDYTGHIALCDFGLCKLNMTAKDKTNTFCGTPEYLAPELLVGKGYTKAVDWWTLGVLLYEMLTGLPPFYDENVNEMYRKILNNTLRFPDDMDKQARHLLTGLLNKDPSQRLGAEGAAEIRNHPFFAKDIDWKKLVQKKIQPPFKPSVESAIDTSNFDSEFTNEPPMDSVVPDSHLSETVQRKFANWSYQRPNAIDEEE